MTVPIFPPEPHSDSRSRTHLTLGEQGWHLRCELQTLSWIEQHPSLDQDGDGGLDASECAQGLDWIWAYWREHWHGSLAGWTAEGSEVTIQEIEPERDGFGYVRYQWIALESSGSWAQMPERLTYAISPFAVSSPGHRDTLTVTWEGHPSQRHEVYTGQAPLSVAPGPTWAALRAQGLLADYWAAGGLALVWGSVWAVYWGGPHRLALQSAGLWFLAAGGGILSADFGATWTADRPTLWRQVLLPLALVYGLLDRWVQKRVRTAWPILLWGWAYGGAWWEGHMVRPVHSHRFPGREAPNLVSTWAWEGIAWVGLGLLMAGAWRGSRAWGRSWPIERRLRWALGGALGWWAWVAWGYRG